MHLFKKLYTSILQNEVCNMVVWQEIILVSHNQYLIEQNKIENNPNALKIGRTGTVL